MRDYYLQTRYVRVPSQVPERLRFAHGTFTAGWAFMPTQEKRLRILEKMSKPVRMIA